MQGKNTRTGNIPELVFFCATERAFGAPERGAGLPPCGKTEGFAVTERAGSIIFSHTLAFQTVPVKNNSTCLFFFICYTLLTQTTKYHPQAVPLSDFSGSGFAFLPDCGLAAKPVLCYTDRYEWTVFRPILLCTHPPRQKAVERRYA